MSLLNIPWFVLGDFNAIITTDEHKGGGFSYYSKNASYFLNFTDENNLFDLHFLGPKYTWCNI